MKSLVPTASWALDGAAFAPAIASLSDMKSSLLLGPPVAIQSYTPVYLRRLTENSRGSSSRRRSRLHESRIKQITIFKPPLARVKQNTDWAQSKSSHAVVRFG